MFIFSNVSTLEQNHAVHVWVIIGLNSAVPKLLHGYVLRVDNHNTMTNIIAKVVQNKTFDKGCSLSFKLYKIISFAETPPCQHNNWSVSYILSGRHCTASILYLLQCLSGLSSVVAIRNTTSITVIKDATRERPSTVKPPIHTTLT